MVVQNQENQEEENQVEKSQMYSCPECGKSFNSRRSLGGHKSKAHVQARKDLSIKNMKTEQTGDLKLLCAVSQCRKEFSSRSALFDHMKIHPDRDWMGTEQAPSAEVIIALPAQAPGIGLNQDLKCWKVRGKRGRPAANSRGTDSSDSESTNEIPNDDLRTVRDMVGKLKRHKSQGPDFLDHDKETNETGEKALEFSSKVTEIKGDDQGPARTQITSKKSKEESLMIKEEDSAVKMVENLKRHKSQGPDFSDHIKESTNGTGEKALGFSSKTASTKVTETEGDDQGPARTQITLKRSKEKSLMIKEDDSAIKMVENLKMRKSRGPDFSDHIKESTNGTGGKALEFLSTSEPTKVSEIKGDDQGPAITLKKSKEKGLMMKEDDSAVKMVENLKRHKAQGPDFYDHGKETNETRGKALEFSSKTESMKVKEIKGDDQGPARLKKMKIKSLTKKQKSQGPDFADHMKETSEPDKKSPEFPSKTNELDSKNSTESTKAAEIEVDDHCRATTQEKTKEKSLIINKDDSAVEVPLKEDKFTCQKCGMSFRSHQAFGGHMASHERMIVRVWNEIDLVHDIEQASETKKKKKKRVKNNASDTDTLESGENTSAPVEKNNETTFDTQPAVKGCSTSSNVPEKSTEIARKGIDFDLNEMPVFDLNERPDEED